MRLTAVQRNPDRHCPFFLMPAGRSDSHSGLRPRVLWLITLAGTMGLFLQAADACAQAPTERSGGVTAARLVQPFGTPGTKGSRDERAPLEGTFTFKDHDLHPDLLFAPYTEGPLLSEPSAPNVRVIEAFRELLARYHERQGVDDNFTIRVTDDRTGRLLELYVLEAERAAYERGGTAVWEEVDRKRREATRRLVDRYAARVPRSAISAKWGRRHQVHEARRDEEAFIEYEVRLARYLGLSLLVTEVGTVETFNRDHLVSSAGARGRYQMTPYLLRQHGLSQYRLRTASGAVVAVAEEWHPLLLMEPAFLTLKGYANAVGHEIPGLSAYHAGPGNIYRIYRLFMEQRGRFGPSSTVVDAYLWGITEGYPVVSRGSSFGAYSRGYVPSVYGSLRATEDLPVDTSLTMRAERVQLRAGEAITLSRLLRLLEARRDRLHLREGSEVSYDLFREMNPHIALPEALGGGVPVRGDIRLVPETQGRPVRFFLPLGATRALAEVGLLDEKATFRFDAATYAEPAAGMRTEWDRQYDALVDEIARFGFNEACRARLHTLVRRFEELAQRNPSHYRRTQLHIIKTHERLWTADVWETLARATAAATRSFPASSGPASSAGMRP